MLMEQEGSMRKGVLALTGLALLAAISWSSAPAQALVMSAPSALKGGIDAVSLTDRVNCWDDCGYDRPRYSRPYYRPYDRPYYRPYHRRSYGGYGYGYRPSYGYGGSGYGYRPSYGYGGYGYGYRPSYGYGGYGSGYRAPWWVSGPYYGAPRPRFYVGSNVYWN
jgi:hypothetical protein